MTEKQPSVVVRLPDDVWGTAKIVAATQGKTPAEMLREAWEQYVARYSHQLYAGEAPTEGAGEA